MVQNVFDEVPHLIIWIWIMENVFVKSQGEKESYLDRSWGNYRCWILTWESLPPIEASIHVGFLYGIIATLWDYYTCWILIWNHFRLLMDPREGILVSSQGDSYTKYSLRNHCHLLWWSYMFDLHEEIIATLRAILAFPS